MEKYEVNEDTLAVIGIDKNQAKILEVEKEYFIDDSAYEVMDYSCKYFGSSYLGRVDGSKKMLGANYKLPIIVEESSELIFFPLMTPDSHKCIWISLKWFKDIIEDNDKSYIVLKNGKKIECLVSKSSIRNQLMRASRLNLILNERKINKNR